MMEYQAIKAECELAVEVVEGAERASWGVL